MKDTLLHGALWLLGQLPLPLLHAFGWVLGHLLWLTPNEYRRITARHLDLCFPERSARERARIAAQFDRERQGGVRGTGAVVRRRAPPAALARRSRGLARLARRLRRRARRDLAHAAPRRLGAGRLLRGAGRAAHRLVQAAERRRRRRDPP